MKRKAFWAGFALTMAVLLPLYAGVVLWQYTRLQPADTPQSAVPMNIPGAGDFMTLLLVAQDQETASYVLLRLDALQNKFTVAALPGETVVVNGGDTRTLDEALAYAGPAYVAAALRETLDMKVDHYICASADVFGDMAADMGTTTVTVPRAISRLAKAGYEIYHRPAGPAPVDAVEGRHILAYGAFTGLERAEIVQQLYGGLLSQNLEALGTLLPAAYRRCSSRCTSDLLAPDLYSIERVLGFLARQAPTVTSSLVPGNWNQDRYELDDTSLSFKAAHLQ